MLIQGVGAFSKKERVWYLGGGIVGEGPGDFRIVISNLLGVL